ncbi:restriction endonuclease subunit S [Latilactobacillus curvatus]|uniref:restriction endonuclease subunit S n=1 Tax=Latilactobacillus curvatus TaxID=28038 RepID=UPI0020C757C1|nr:restriction endonuclease subunit S [Latilactobacillus curvatus]MCP8876692.1 restriction endonuclease subunit S [Latilactobacillus curvatus]
MKEQKKQPELRFKGFTDDWEQHKLGDEVRIVMGQSPNSENYTDDPNDYILVQGNADMKNGRVFPRVWTTQVTKQAEKDDLILSVRAPVGDIGKTAYDVVIGRGVAAIKGNEFIFQNLGKMKSDGYWTRYSTGSTFESINSTDIKEAIISVPAIEEQNKIGSFFKQLDNTIALQQRKLDLLTKLKQGYLQQLFPSKDKYLPRLRFKEFNGDWKQCTMGEIFTERTERSGEGELISVTINSGVVKASELDRKDNSSKNKSNYKKVEIGDIAYNSMRMWQGASGYSPYKGILSPAYTVITPKNEIDSEFFAYDFKRFNMIQAFKRNSQGLTSDTWNLKFPTLKSIKINVPHFDEQRRISNTFNQVDNMLLLQQTKIDQLNKLKQAYLQKLFP